MMSNEIDVIMPVKDSMEIAERAISAVVSSGYNLTVYDDFSAPANAERLDGLAAKWHFQVVHLSDLVSSPSPNYWFILRTAIQKALHENRNLLIVESDVIVHLDTIDNMLSVAKTKTDAGMVACATEDANCQINYPYEFAATLLPPKGSDHGAILTDHHLSFCCTMLTTALLRVINTDMFTQRKNWYDVPISHLSARNGLNNYVLLKSRVTHYPHSSRPWKMLKYKNPVLYYLRKWFGGKDKI